MKRITTLLLTAIVCLLFALTFHRGPLTYSEDDIVASREEGSGSLFYINEQRLNEKIRKIISGFQERYHIYGNAEVYFKYPEDLSTEDDVCLRLRAMFSSEDSDGYDAICALNDMISVAINNERSEAKGRNWRELFFVQKNNYEKQRFFVSHLFLLGMNPVLEDVSFLTWLSTQDDCCLKILFIEALLYQISKECPCIRTSCFLPNGYVERVVAIFDGTHCEKVQQKVDALRQEILEMK